jgi:hypothetical protein
VTTAERLARLDAVACIHGAGFGSCPAPFCCHARAAVLMAAADLEAEQLEPPAVPRRVARSTLPFCRWCHERIRGALTDEGWAHLETSRLACADGEHQAEAVTPLDQERALRRRRAAAA